MTIAAPQTAPGIVDKKRYGVFYTPEEVTDILSNWAIQSGEDTVLEPSFGGCQFLSSAKKRLTSLGASDPDSQLFGSDIDPAAFVHLEETVSHNGKYRFIQDDFLQLNPNDFGNPRSFEVLLGNPPYISNQNLPKDQYRQAGEIIKKLGIAGIGKASLWAYFVLHGMNFLKKGGRMAWVLPSSFLYADYAQKVKELLCQRFSQSLVIRVGDRLFLGDGTEEISIVVLCKGFDESTDQKGGMSYSFVQSPHQLANPINHWERASISSRLVAESAILSLISREAVDTYLEMKDDQKTRLLGDYCKIEIGIVSGANFYFIINSERARSEKLPVENLCFILPSFRFVRGLTLKTSNLIKLRDGGKACILVDTTLTNCIKRELEVYLAKFPSERFDGNVTFHRRVKAGKLWHSFNDNRIPDAFFPYMLKQNPFIVLNSAKINSTNSVHRLFFQSHLKQFEQMAIAISMLSTFSQLSAEIEGRTYGGGTLKLEPSEAERVSILLPLKFSNQEVRKVFWQLNQLVSSQRFDDARVLADSFVMKDYAKRTRNQYAGIFSDAIRRIRKTRLPYGNSS